jgi:fructose-1,6-bisphosphatase/inositol monophosphatase family enzyme
MKAVKYEDVLDLLYENAEKNILPYFQRLQDDQISTKKHEGDLVTVADVASEEFLTDKLSKLLPDSLVVGEEAVSKDESVLKTFDSDKPIWIIDPIDGTFNFANGRSRWGVFVSLAYKGEVVFANMFNLLGDELIFAYKGEGTHHWTKADDALNQIQLSKPDKPYKDYAGHVGGAQAWHFKALNGLCGHFENIRCSLHDAYDFLNGEIDFNFHKATTPWDHSGPYLTVTEAGGLFRIGRKKIPFEPHMMGEGYVLMTYDDDSWDALGDSFFTAMERKTA